MKKYLSLFVFLLSFTFAHSQKVIFLHHSTGSGVYYGGNVPQWISNYNTQHSTNYQISERSYPDTPYPWANYPYDYWNLWINNQCNNTNPNIPCMDKLTQDYDVIIFKHCFPGASVAADNGNPSVSSSVQTLANYKLQYRALRAMMDSYPNKKFIVWTLVPLHRLGTNSDEAARARQFVDWVKTSWLTEDAKLHPNIYIFDFFGYAAESNATPLNGKLNCLKYDYELSHGDNNSHPNDLANQTIGPIFAEFIVNTIKTEPVTGITVTGGGGANTITTDNGTLQLSAAVLPAIATDKTVTWSIVSGTGQATINAAGLVTAVDNGTITARATANDGSGVYGTLAITISNQVIHVTSITVIIENGKGGSTNITTDKGTLKLSAVVFPANATDKTVTWSMVNGTGQATISSSGLVTAVDNGTVTARVTANCGSGAYDTLLINISDQIGTVTGITVTKEKTEPLKIIVSSYEMKILLNDNYISWKAGLYNMQGGLILSKLVDSDICVFDTSSLPSGIYIAVLSKGENRRVAKVIKP